MTTEQQEAMALLGKTISKGIINGFLKFTAFMCLGFWLTWYFSTDDSDEGPLKRSNMNIRTDDRTGCQYLESYSGALTPRMDGNIQMGCKTKKDA